MVKKTTGLRVVLDELETLGEWFSQNDLDLTEAMEKFERGLQIAAEAKKILTGLELKIVELKDKYKS